MADGTAWSQGDGPDVLMATLEAIVAGGDLAGECPVFVGAAPKGQAPPFVVCWPISPQQLGMGLAAEDGGKAHGRWQIGGHGANVGQAMYLARAITDLAAWPQGWSLDGENAVGPMQVDTSDDPRTYWWPIDFVVNA